MCFVWDSQIAPWRRRKKVRGKEKTKNPSKSCLGVSKDLRGQFMCFLSMSTRFSFVHRWRWAHYL